MWIGLNDKANESVYTWDDGTPVTANSYYNWEPGEPSGIAIAGVCVYFVSFTYFDTFKNTSYLHAANVTLYSLIYIARDQIYVNPGEVINLWCLRNVTEFSLFSYPV